MTRCDPGVTPPVRIVEVDDAAAAAVRGTMASTDPFARGFPRAGDLEAIDAWERGAIVFLIVSDGAVVGTCGTHGPAPRSGPFELGWGIVCEARGRGAGTAAVCQLLSELETRHPASPLLAHTMWRDSDDGLVAESPASERILTSQGFTAEPIPGGPGGRAWRRAAPAGPS